MVTATKTASSARWCAREGSRGGNGVQGKREAVEGVEASPWRREGVGEAATAKQEVEASRARVRAVSVLLAEEEEDKGEEEVGWAGQMGWPAGPGKWRQVIPFSLCLFLIISVFYFAGLF